MSKSYMQTCGFCNKSFLIEKWRVERFGADNVYCSRVCAGKARSRKSEVSLVCSGCGKSFTTKRFRKVGKRAFCTDACKIQFVKSGGHLQEYAKKIIVYCSNCGTEILVHPCKTRYNNEFYCSKQCRSKHIMGKNNPAYRSGMGRKREYSANWKGQRRAVILRDGGKCQVCHKTPKIARYLHVHHIIPAYTFNGDWEKANQINNLITLCSTCHKKVEKGIIPVQPRLV